MYKCFPLLLLLLLLLYSDKCRELLANMSDAIGKVNIYDIYDVCNMNLSSPYSRTTQVITLKCLVFKPLYFISCLIVIH